MHLNILIFVFIQFIWSVKGNLPAPYYPIDDIAVNCGSIGNSSALDGREWTGDVGTEFSLSRKQAGNSISSRAVHTLLSGDPVPYLTARASHSTFFYTFKLQPGPKFIRLHFNPASYIGFEKSTDFFNVQAGPYKLLHNFSASITARSLGVISFSKEFCVSVEETRELTLMISPSRTNAYAFVNGIEIISMPSGLYYTPEGEQGADVVAPHKYKYYVDNTTALETVYRLNMGGSSVSPIEDTGMFRRWSKDSDYMLEKKTNSQVYHATSMIKYTNIPTYSAPLKVYQTSWSTKSSYIKKSTTFTWKLPVDLGFRYLVRLHFCQHELPDSKRAKKGHGEFGILVNNQIAETNADVTKWGGGYGVAVYKDYVTTIRGDKMDGKTDLSIVIFSKSGLIEGKLNGLEVFKLSNPDDSLAGSNPEFHPHSSLGWMPRLPAFGSLNSIATKLIILFTLLNIIVYIQRWFWEEKLGKKRVPSQSSLSSSDDACRCFSLAEINSATCNFDKALVIGMGGFAKVYKGVIDDGTKTVAVKRMSSRSQEGSLEFWMEIQMIWRLRHNHLVSLVGYCDDGIEMILVYEYMPHGTLAEHLFKQSPDDSRDFTPLTWDQRLKICIGAARGLDYLHTGTHHGVIHRDVKTSNILLDENFVGKISDFGLSKVENTSQLLAKSYVSTNIKGTVGYLDPDYFLSRKLSRKSDVYAFGVVLFEVLCGRPAVDPGLEEDQRSLAIWARQSIREGKLEQIIDPHLRGEISPHCLKVFVELAEKCLENQPKKRPTMAKIISGLEFALEQQERTDWFLPEEPAYASTLSVSSSPRSEQSTSNGSKKSLKPRRLKSWRWDLLWNAAKTAKMDSFVSISSSKTYEDYCRRFLLSEIHSATNDFDENLIVGTGDFSIVYKGYIDYGSRAVIMKRFKKFMLENWSKKTDFPSEFSKEIEMLCQLRHPNLVSLIGYCYHRSEMILVYEYVVNGSLRDHLYGSQNSDPLNWKQRLQICIDAAQGLDFLQTGGVKTVLHRDVNPGNILLDEKLVAKVSDYGLSKVGPLYAVSDNLTNVLGNCLGYLDPECMFANGTTPTEKSDVYSFGLVLLEVLCGRKLEDHMLQRDQVFLRSWVKSNIAKGSILKIIDPSLKGKIAPACLKEFIKIAERCLADQSTERPSMSEVVKGLKLAAQEQESAKSNYGSFSLKM
ncbi:serine/threonine/dual specificity protein kinase, catalytic domain-containing protein [Artemisia annua]|uniref:Serine/threonine/dual specificity protein kinase, catalytic domain-containing protein n=1 Tax=Artemisia annua TaxID=35608 RepID=A0A2U1M6E8_ARTAN|nr:serine/threonine/dual specificity protein kinase, catalytic domain-containing protein [Artemisia annua]